MFTSYFDDSGGSDTSAQLVAGFVSSVEKWLSFDEEWKNLLGDRIFRMADIASGTGDFVGITNPEKNALVKNAVEITKGHVEYSFSFSLPTIEFDAVNEQFMFEESVKSAYAFCGLGCAVASRSWLSEQDGNENQMRYVFEDQPNGTGGLTKLMRYYAFPVPDFESKKTRPLQAADLIAWEHQRFHRGVEEKEYTQESDIRRSLRALSEGEKFKWTVFRKGTLINWCKEFNVPERSLDYSNFERAVDIILETPNKEYRERLEKREKERKKSNDSAASPR
jgi:hypothetical protein